MLGVKVFFGKKGVLSKIFQAGKLEKVLKYGYHIHPEALKIIESLEEEKALEVLGSFFFLKNRQPKKPRRRAQFDDGKERYTLIFKKDVTEKTANITLKEARKLSETATLERIREALFGKKFEIEGVRLNGGYFLVKEIREV